jgi:hypothetical protein
VRIFILFWFAVAAWCASFIIRNGMLYVSHSSSPHSVIC